MRMSPASQITFVDTAKCVYDVQCLFGDRRAIRGVTREEMRRPLRSRTEVVWTASGGSGSNR